MNEHDIKRSTYAVIRLSPGCIPRHTLCSRDRVCDTIRECQRCYPDHLLCVAFISPLGAFWLESVQEWLAIEYERTAPRCPECGYTPRDAKKFGDHHLCKGTIPKSDEVVE